MPRYDQTVPPSPIDPFARGREAYMALIRVRMHEAFEAAVKALVLASTPPDS